MRKATIPQTVKKMLELMEINDSIDKKQYIESIYGEHDNFIARSFDVHFAKAKKMIQEDARAKGELYDKVFKSVNKKITRLN